jgi:hypothetical protein
LYREQFPPDHKTILKLIARGRETGQMQPVRGRSWGCNVRTVEHEEAVLNVFEEDGTRSIRTVSREMGLSKSSVQRVLADNRRHPYHYTRIQHLLPEDYPIRREFCLWLINHATVQSGQKGIIWLARLVMVRAPPAVEIWVELGSMRYLRR